MIARQIFEASYARFALQHCYNEPSFPAGDILTATVPLRCPFPPHAIHVLFVDLLYFQSLLVDNLKEWHYSSSASMKARNHKDSGMWSIRQVI